MSEHSGENGLLIPSHWNPHWNYRLGGEPRSICACPDGPYEGARLVMTPRFCERCGGLVSAAPDAARPAVTAADPRVVAVLAAHTIVYENDGGDYGGRSWFECSCEYATEDEHRAHQAAALSEAGIGVLADANSERARHYAREQQLLDDNGDAYWRGHKDGAQAVLRAVQSAPDGYLYEHAARAAAARVTTEGQ